MWRHFANGVSLDHGIDYVEFDSNQLVQRLRDSIEQAVRDGRICDSQAGRFLKFYEEGLGGYTYLEEPG